MSASTKTSATQSKLEAARAEHAAKTAAAAATAEACKTNESEPDTVHAAAIETMLEAAPTSWTRTIIGWIAGVFAGTATWYYGAMACNILLAAVGGGFLGFLAYMLCVLVLFLASCVSSWVASSLVTGGTALSYITSKWSELTARAPIPTPAKS